MTTKWFLLATAATLGLAAQTPPAQLTASVPFAFEAKGKQMPAGKYTVLPSGQNSYVTIRHEGTGVSLFALAIGTSGNHMKNGNLEFRSHNDRYYLTAITSSENGIFIKIPQSGAGKEVAKSRVPATIIAMAK